MIIFNKQGGRILTVTVEDNSYRHRAVMGDNNLTLYYSLPEHVELPVGAYCDFQGQRYFLKRPEAFKMHHSRNYEYAVTMETYQDDAKRWKFRNPVDGRLKFPLTAKPKEHLQMVVDNLNRHDSGWTVGDCIDDVEKLITYDHDYCWDALSKQASEFKTEFEIAGKIVSLHKVEYNKSTPLPLSYGRGNGFKSGVGRSNSGDKIPVEILFVQGGERNIDRSKYPESETLRATSSGCLILPVGQTIGYDGEYFEDEDGYNSDSARHYSVDDLGMSIRNIDKELSTLAEDSLDRSDDYPKRVGAISQVVEVDKAKNLYDIIDNTIPEDLNYEDYLIGEEQMTVIFQSGMLAGREFDVKYLHKPKTINGTAKAGRRFEIVPQEIDGVMMPGGNFLPKAGDTYAIFGCMLPDAYIRNDEDKSGASWDMFRAAVKYMFDNEDQKYSFTGELDGIWAKNNWENIGAKIRLGGFIRFTNEQFEQDGVLVRITNIKDYINNPHSPKIELSNETVSGSVSSALKDLQSKEVIIEESHNAALRYTKRRFRDAKETIEMIEAALSDNFSNRINPIAVETMSLLVGDERLQYQFVAEPESTDAVPHNISWDEATKQLIADAGTIQHQTLGIDTIRASHAPEEYLYWNVASFESASLEDGSVKYYLYIRAPKQFNGSAGSAEFRLDASSHKLEEGDYYWLLVGVLNSEYDGERSFATLYGFSEILPGRITANKLLASDGQSYFDMVNAALKLKDKLQFNTNGDGELKVKGVIVQSRNGVDESPIGCFRGEYNPQATYFKGDEVTYRKNAESAISTYRCISETPISGILPENSMSWSVSAQGLRGDDGTSVKIKDSFEALLPNKASYIGILDATVPGEIYLLIDNETDQSGLKCWIATIPKGASTPVVIKATDGDGYINSQTGHLFIAGANGWTDAGQIKGDPGADGSPGKYTDYRYATNGSPTDAPNLSKNDPDPNGWDPEMPPISLGKYLWMTKAVRSGKDDTLLSPWDTPVRMTAKDGTPGENGKNPVMVYRGGYSSSKTYYGNEVRLDCVKFNNQYYIARIDAPSGSTGFSNISPANRRYWNVFGASFDSIATDLLLAEGANIANFFFYNERLESTTKNVDGDPNLWIDGKTGNIWIDGSIQNPFKRINNTNVMQYLKSSAVLDGYYEVDLNKAGLKIMFENGYDAGYDPTQTNLRILMLPSNIKFAGAEFTLYNSTSKDIGITGTVSPNGWTSPSSLSINSTMIGGSTIVTFVCIPLLAKDYPHLSAYAQNGYIPCWILKEKNTFK